VLAALFLPMCCLQRHDIDFGKGLLEENVERLAVSKGIDPGIGINVIRLRKRFGQRANLIRANGENDIHILGAPSTPIIRTGHCAAHIICPHNKDSPSDLGADYFDKLDTKRIERHHVRRLEQLGYTVTLAPKEAA
jgi:hypothetical protein